MFQVYLTGNFIAVSARANAASLYSPLLADGKSFETIETTDFFTIVLQLWRMVAAIPGLQTPLIQSVSFVSALFEPLSDTSVNFGGTVIITILR